MDTLESAKVKDGILNFLSKTKPTWQSVENLISGHVIEHLPRQVLLGYVVEMGSDDMVRLYGEPALDAAFSITATGERFLFEGGYTKQFEVDSASQLKEAQDDELNRVKTNLEIKSLRIQTWVSIAAIIISIAAIIISIFKD